MNVFDEEGRRMVRDINDAGVKNEYDLLPLVTKYTLNAICGKYDKKFYRLSEEKTFHNLG